ncbi:MAG TPA: ethanolamine ammonia-lyase subunit EutC [Bryobacteraceae bacterium]|nr:ethanolamine ammonia-lyase subunit EutC [Bryobacteraceae bacterium]
MAIDLKSLTPARVTLGRSGHSLTTAELLRFDLDHARARDAVHEALDSGWLKHPHIEVASAALDRRRYLLRPDLGRQLSPESAARLASGDYDAAIVIADGLSAPAIHHHAAPFLDMLLPRLKEEQWRLAPLVVVRQARVAIADEIAHRLGARMAVILIGERPGLTSPDSLGIYLTWEPRPARTTDAERNCISNVRPEGLPYPLAAHKLLFLMHESRRRRLSGVSLKESAKGLE